MHARYRNTLNNKLYIRKVDKRITPNIRTVACLDFMLLFIAHAIKGVSLHFHFLYQQQSHPVVSNPRTFPFRPAL
jgi:hypothetical protein